MEKTNTKLIDKLVLIGNGFDRWQGLPNSYDNFRQYYYRNIAKVLKAMEIVPVTDTHDGSKKVISPVELIYGNNIFSPDKLSDEFFWQFEDSLALIDDQMINLYFGTTDRGLYDLQETVHQAIDILQKLFGGWISEIKISKVETERNIFDQCYFINFNYTGTLEKRFGVDSKYDYHIHGEYDDPEDIIFGHSTHPEMALPELMEQKFGHSVFGGKSKRLMGEYLIEDVLYETDKHVQDNIDDLCTFMSLSRVHIENISDIYVLGHSFANPDYEYFEFLQNVTRKDTDMNSTSAIWKLQQYCDHHELDEDKLFRLIELNIMYALHHRTRDLKKPDLPFPKMDEFEKDMQHHGYAPIPTDEKSEKEAVRLRFLFEQSERTNECLREYCILKGLDKERTEQALKNHRSVLSLAAYLDGGHEERTANAHWHISYYSEDDKDRIMQTMKRLGCDEQDYTLYHGIDECIESMNQ